MAEAPHAIATRLQAMGRGLPRPLPEVLEPVDPDEIQRWFADEAIALWRHLRPPPTEKA